MGSNRRAQKVSLNADIAISESKKAADGTNCKGILDGVEGVEPTLPMWRQSYLK